MRPKQVWVSVAFEGEWNEKKPYVTESIEAGVDVIVCLPEDVERVKELGNVKVAVPLMPESPG